MIRKLFKPENLRFSAFDWKLDSVTPTQIEPNISKGMMIRLILYLVLFVTNGLVNFELLFKMNG